MIRKHLCRLHMEGDAHSIEGIWVGTSAGHYRLKKGELLEAEGRTQSLDGETWVPKERVLFLQRLR